MQYIRHAKGALTVAVATAVCHALMFASCAWVRDDRASDERTVFSSACEFLLTTAASRALMSEGGYARCRSVRERWLPSPVF